jgi:hypothetical protein
MTNAAHDARICQRSYDLHRSSCRKEGAAIPFLDASFRSPGSRPGKQTAPTPRAVLWYERRAPSVRGHLWVNGVAPEGAHYLEKTRLDALTDQRTVYDPEQTF